MKKQANTKGNHTPGPKKVRPTPRATASTTTELPAAKSSPIGKWSNAHDRRAYSLAEARDKLDFFEQSSRLSGAPLYEWATITFAAWGRPINAAAAPRPIPRSAFRAIAPDFAANSFRDEKSRTIWHDVKIIPQLEAPDAAAALDRMGLREAIRDYVYSDIEVQKAIKTLNPPENCNLYLDYLIRERHIPSVNGLVPLVFTNPRAVRNWNGLFKLAQSAVQYPPDFHDLSPREWAAQLVKQSLDEEMPEAFFRVFNTLRDRFSILFWMLATSAIGAKGINPTSRDRQPIEARTWTRPDFAVDVRIGNIVNTHSSSVVWEDITLHLRDDDKMSFVLANRGGRPEEHPWMAALDILIEDGLDGKNPAETGSELVKMMLDAFNRAGAPDEPTHESTRRWLTDNLPRLYSRATARSVERPETKKV